MPSSRSDMPSGGVLKSPTTSMGLLTHPCSFASANMLLIVMPSGLPVLKLRQRVLSVAVAAPLLGRGHATTRERAHMHRRAGCCAEPSSTSASRRGSMKPGR